MLPCLGCAWYQSNEKKNWVCFMFLIYPRTSGLPRGDPRLSLLLAEAKRV